PGCVLLRAGLRQCVPQHSVLPCCECVCVCVCVSECVCGCLGQADSTVCHADVIHTSLSVGSGGGELESQRAASAAAPQALPATCKRICSHTYTHTHTHTHTHTDQL